MLPTSKKDEKKRVTGLPNSSEGRDVLRAKKLSTDFEVPKSPADTVHDKRVEVIKKLRQGEGLTLEKVQELSSDELSAFSFELPVGSGADDVYELIRWSALALTPDKNTRAIVNALGLDLSFGPPGNLTERRLALCDRLDVSPRTLSTYEEVGADMLAKQVDTTAAIRRQGGDVELGVVAATVETLKSRVNQLEFLVENLIEQNKKLAAVNKVRLEVAESNIKSLWAAARPELAFVFWKDELERRDEH